MSLYKIQVTDVLHLETRLLTELDIYARRLPGPHIFPYLDSTAKRILNSVVGCISTDISLATRITVSLMTLPTCLPYLYFCR